MDDSQPNHRDATGRAFAEVVRKQGRAHREAVTRYARLYYDTLGWEKARIQEALEIDSRTVDRILAADGVLRCVDCAFGLHRACTGYFAVAVGDIIPCECSCRSIRS